MHEVGMFFTTRHGGRSRAPYDSLNLGGGVGDDPDAVTANRASVAARTGVSPGRLVFMHQVHSATVTVLDGVTAIPTLADTPIDGLVTTLPGVALAALVADCVPVLAVDTTAGVIAAVHAGRPGSAAGIGPAMLEAMSAAGAHLGRIRVWLGPAICGRCYEVPTAMRDQVDAVLPGSAAETSWGTPSLDLRAGLRRQLFRAGVGAVTVDRRCTRETSELYSYRRDGLTGRFAGIIWMPASGG